MSDDRRQSADSIALGFTQLVESVRSDVREDIRDLRTELGAVEERVTERVGDLDKDQKETRQLIVDFGVSHGAQHEAEASDRREAHTAFYEFIRRAELDQARRDGALGVVRWSVELLSRNAPRLIALIAAVAAAGLALSGSVTISVK